MGGAMPELPERLDLNSAEIAGDKVDELLQLFPEVRTEDGQIDFDRLKLALGETVDVGKERYGLTWPGKADCFKTIQAPSLGTLLPAKDESVNWDTTENLIIEGDNLEVLKLLQKSYLGKVKMIYIDPPYNTGNDFIYPDDYAESLKTYLQYTGQMDAEGRRFSTNPDTDGRFHSKWLNMMYPRLYLARNLLRDDGVIFISIGDREVGHARDLVDEVFGEDNVIGLISRVTKTTSDAGTFFAPSVDYVICATRNRDMAAPFKVPLTEDQVSAYTRSDAKGRYKLVGFYQASLTLERSRNARYFLEAPDGTQCIPPPGKRWRTIRSTFDDFAARGEIEFVRVPASPLLDADGNRSAWNVYTKQYLDRRSAEGRTPRDFLFDVRNHLGAEELEQLGIPYDFPKPTLLVKSLAEMVSPSLATNDIVLDFFAGSGTTGHAVMDLNKQDGGHRSFILVQLPEPTDRDEYRTIADITKERVRRVIAMLNADDTDDTDDASPQDRGFRVFKLADSNIAAWEGGMAHDEATLTKQLELHIDHVRDERSADDVLYEILLKSGFPLSTRVESVEIEATAVTSVAEGALLICLDQALSLELVRAVAARKPERAVFLDEGFAGNDALKANAAQVFKAAGVTFRTV
jgi:adenine-specific DNA-methyltransferase